MRQPRILILCYRILRNDIGIRKPKEIFRDKVTEKPIKYGILNI